MVTSVGARQSRTPAQRRKLPQLAASAAAGWLQALSASGGQTASMGWQIRRDGLGVVLLKIGPDAD